MDRRRDRGTRTRQRIVEAALALLAEEGPDAYSAASLAKRAGVSKATLFHHFASSAEVPLAAAEALFSQSIEVTGAHERSLHGALRAIGRRSSTLMRRHASFLRAYMVFFVKALFDDRHRTRMVTGMDAVKAELEQELIARLPEGLSASERRALTHLVAAALDGLGLHYLMRPDDAVFRTSWALLSDAIASHYAPAKEPSK